METWAIVLIVIVVILVVTGLGVGIYFATRSSSAGGTDNKGNGGDNKNPGGLSDCDALFKKVISQKTFTDAARTAALGIYDLPKDSNNNITGCTLPDTAVQLYTYNIAWANNVTTTCNDLVVQLLGFPQNCDIAYSNAIQRYPDYLKTCNPEAMKFINIWASGKCASAPGGTQNSRRRLKR